MKKLIWFMHFHKCAGTSIVHLFKKNGYKLYENNANGNPLDENSDVIELWKYDQLELSSFIDRCHGSGVGFVATEWGVPDIDFLSSREDIVLVTVLRDPYARFVSNFRFDVKNGFTDSTDFNSYLNNGDGLYTADNYYTRMLSSKGCGESLSSSDLDTSVAMLKKFDHVATVEKGLDALCSDMGLKYFPVVKNATRANFVSVFLSLLRLDIRKFCGCFVAEKRVQDAGFENYFREINVMDYVLFDTVVNSK
jgi:hypothetical protein